MTTIHLYDSCGGYICSREVEFEADVVVYDGEAYIRQENLPGKYYRGSFLDLDGEAMSDTAEGPWNSSN